MCSAVWSLVVSRRQPWYHPFWVDWAQSTNKLKMSRRGVFECASFSFLSFFPILLFKILRLIQNHKCENTFTHRRKKWARQSISFLEGWRHCGGCRDVLCLKAASCWRNDYLRDAYKCPIQRWGHTWIKWAQDDVIVNIKPHCTTQAQQNMLFQIPTRKQHREWRSIFKSSHSATLSVVIELYCSVYRKLC